jgi:hypothetical protein
MVDPTTKGAASCPLLSPVEKVKATCSPRTFCRLIWPIAE